MCSSLNPFAFIINIEIKQTPHTRLTFNVLKLLVYSLYPTASVCPVKTFPGVNATTTANVMQLLSCLRR
jgi:hypothetical protein